MKLNHLQQQLNKENTVDFSSLRALFLNCTLKKSPETSNTGGLIDMSKTIMESNGVAVEVLRPVDSNIAFGVYPDMTEHGWEQDEWPRIQEMVMASDILVIGSPIWLGDKSAVAKMVIERLYSYSSRTNDRGQYLYYGKVGGCLITGNEDGAKHCAMNILYSLQHMGYMIPPQVDSGWVGEAGPGPSYLDKYSGGPENDYTNRTVTFLSWNLMHAALNLKKQGGFPAYGNQNYAWEDRKNKNNPQPEKRV